MTESQAGSDLQAIATTATLEGIIILLMTLKRLSPMLINSII